MARISRVEVEETPQRWRVEQNNVPLHNPHLQIFRNGENSCRGSFREALHNISCSEPSYTKFDVYVELCLVFPCLVQKEHLYPPPGRPLHHLLGWLSRGEQVPQLPGSQCGGVCPGYNEEEGAGVNTLLMNERCVQCYNETSEQSINSF